MANIRVKMTPQDNLLVTNYRVFQGSTVKIGDIFDVNTDGAVNGSMLMYNSITTVWEASEEISDNNISIDGGEF